MPAHLLAWLGAWMMKLREKRSTPAPLASSSSGIPGGHRRKHEHLIVLSLVREGNSDYFHGPSHWSASPQKGGGHLYSRGLVRRLVAGLRSTVGRVQGGGAQLAAPLQPSLRRCPVSSVAPGSTLGCCVQWLQRPPPRRTCLGRRQQQQQPQPGNEEASLSCLSRKPLHLQLLLPGTLPHISSSSHPSSLPTFLPSSFPRSPIDSGSTGASRVSTSPSNLPSTLTASRA